MPSKTLIRFRNAFASLSAAARVAAATEGHRRPQAEDLKTLGINPAAFDSIAR